jgi:hypothetical protein
LQVCLGAGWSVKHEKPEGENGITVIEVQYVLPLVRNAVWKLDSASDSGPAVLNDVV